MKVTVCWKWVSLDRDREADRRWSGVSAADEAALEIGLRLAERTGGEGGNDVDVTVICLGPAAVEDVLREAIAVGATSVKRIDASSELDSRVVAVALAEHAAGSDLVLCGDYSLDRGTGSVPAFLADELGAAQALGLIDVDTSTSTDTSTSVGTSTDTSALRVLRRLDGGRREVLDVAAPAVLSVEGSVARLRRAPLAASLAARQAPVEVVRGPHGRLPEVEIHPFRPRARTLPAPGGGTLDRVRQILDVGGADAHAETLTLDPPDAAAKIIAQLRDWGYLDADRPTAAARSGDVD